MKLKRLTALILCLALVLSLAACGGDGGQSSSSGSSSGSAPEESSASTPEESGDGASAPEESGASASGIQGADWFEGRDFSEHYTISLASVQIEDARDYNKGDDWVSQWTEKFNIEWEITPLTFENWGERLRIWINSDDMPDMAVYNYNNAEAVNYADQGLVKMLPEDWKTAYPNLAAAQEKVPISSLAEDTMGGTFYLFRPAYSNHRPADKMANHMSVYMRKDWGAAVDVEVKPAMKVSEIIEYARKVKEKNPGNVEGDFYPIVNTSGRLARFVQANNTYAGLDDLPFYKGDDGKYHWGPADESTLEALKMLNQAYKDGLIDPEFYTIQDMDDYGAFRTSGISAVCDSEAVISQIDTYDKEMAASLGVNFEEAVEIVTPLGEDGYFHANTYGNYWGTNIFSPHIDEGKFERVLSMMDYSCTDLGQYEIRCGIQDVDWTYDESTGEITSTLKEGEDLWTKYALLPVYVNMMVLSDDFGFVNPIYKQSLRDKATQLHVLHAEQSTEESFPSEIDWNVALHDSQALNLATMTYADEYAALIVKEGDIETNWKAWVNEKMPMIQPVLDELDAGAGN